MIELWKESDPQAGKTARARTSCLNQLPISSRVRKPEGETCSAIRRRATDRGEARRIFLLWRVVSCGDAALRWRTKLHLGSGEPLEDHHRSSTLGAEPKITGVLGAWRVLLCGRRRGERLKASRQESGTSPVWPRSRSAGCARSHPEASATGSDGGIHRVRESSVAVHFCERSCANER
jgi:hypothetical protein